MRAGSSPALSMVRWSVSASVVKAAVQGDALGSRLIACAIVTA